MSAVRPFALIALYAALALALSGCRTQDALDTTHAMHGGEDCASCHAGALRASAFDHAAVGFDQPCSTCHGETDWRPQRAFDHATTGFPLENAHAAADCADCHDSGADTPDSARREKCVDCHGDDRNAAVPDHTSFPDDCTRCHDTRAWSTGRFAQHDRFFPLTGAHARAECAACHADGRLEGTPRLCVGCHAADRDAGRQDHAGLPEGCERCHTTDAWIPTTYQHTTRFPLIGAHVEAPCAGCHADGRFTGTPHACATCHADDRNAARAPAHAGFPDDCAGCHTASAWRPATLDHAARYPLIGRHAEAACTACHPAGAFAPVPETCAGCHGDDRAGARPDHTGIAVTCDRCHTPSGWWPSQFHHDDFWRLRGAHVLAACGECHPGGRYSATPTTCFDCHADDRPAQPDHTDFSAECSACHGPTNWRPATVDHDRFFPLVGLHAGTPCESCHTGGRFEGTPTACEGCHEADAARATPSHTGFPPACADCHAPTGWRPAGLDHDAFYPIEGGHVALACEQCHVEGRFAGTPRTCDGCHDQARDAAAPSHRGLPDACTRCHTQDAWRPTTYDHDALFPLTGAHRVPDCASCHLDEVFRGTPHECGDCHAADRDAAAAPVHAGFPEDCAVCHNARAWAPSTFNHARSFVLSGRHADAPCAGCHADGRFAGTPDACLDCHAADRAVAVPSHAELPTQCAACHTAAAWTPAALDHDRFWTLNGAHVDAECADCHVGGRYAGTARTCAGCHRPDVPNEPDHGGFVPTCESCHSATAWRPAALNHDRFFPLTGRHVGRDCAECHPGGVYEGTSHECRDCHEQDTVGAVPPHDRLGPTCADCHTTDDWRPAELDHTEFFLIEGRHQDALCDECHLDAVFAGTPRECVGCHLDDRATATPDHSGLAENCAACHQQTGWQPAELDHDQFFVLRDRHVGPECAACHPGGRYEGTPTECGGCHADDRAAVRQPDHGGLPENCEACHQQTGWRPAALDHTQYWPLEGPHDTPDCAACHPGGRYTGTPRDCAGCHQADADAVADPPHADFPARCEACHTNLAWRPAHPDHDPFWPLSPPHAAADCATCHPGGRYAGTSRVCSTCHQPDADAVPDPPHVDLPNTCDACHTDTAWRPADVDHDRFWPLSPPHAVADCADCHLDGRFSGTTRLCVGCHRADAAAVAAPRHDGFPDTCTDCHVEAAWQPAQVDHGRFWPLEGAHDGPACDACHAGGRFAGTPRVCIGCHAQDKAGVVQPPHAALPDTCETCHTKVAWRPATFDHVALFPLNGRHAAVACADCHVAAVYRGTPRTCVGCHAPDKVAARPTHVRLSDDCARCHTEQAWRPATYPHVFPVPHRGRSACIDCHRDPADYSHYACTTCHEHSEANAGGHHNGVNNYSWVDAECVRCHPRGRVN